MLAFAGLFIIGGFAMVVHPSESVIFHQGRSSFSGSMQHVSQGGMQIFGIVEIAMGMSIVGLVFYKRGK